MWKAILKAALLAGTLDIAAACVHAYLRTGTPPARVLRYVASGVFGPEAFRAGNEMLFWGLLFHYIIAFACALSFFLAYPYFKKWLGSVALNSMLIGAVAWCVTELLIVPMSNTPKLPFTAVRIFVGAAILMVCIGWPIAWQARKYFEKV